nr:hormone receptor 4-like [Procambarus clarkii]
MTGMAEARSNTPKYTCACGFSQEERKSKFLGKCRHCHTRAKYLRGQSSFDSGSAARGRPAISSSSTGSSPNNSSSSSSSSSTASANNSDGDGGNSTSSSRSSSSNGGGGGGGGGEDGGGGSAGAASGTAASPAASSNRLVRQASVAETRRRSRSMDRYDAFRVTEPPPYSWVAPEAPAAGGAGGGGREGGRDPTRGRAGTVRRAESEDSARGSRASQLQTPPPPYEVAQSQSYYQFPPSYEEALANSMSAVRLAGGGAAPAAAQPPTRDPTPTPTSTIRSFLTSSVSSQVALLPVGLLASRSSRVLEEQAAVLEAQREAQVEAQRQAQREAQREAQLERERDMERQRLRELQLAQYCGCAKCQSLYYSYYYDDAMNDGGAFPMETQVLMQEVLTDGLAFCSIM